MPDLPAGTVTFLFTDIEGSTALVRRLGDARYAVVRAEHHRLVREGLRAHGGAEVDTQGDAFFVAFATARSALACALAVQRAVAAYSWPDENSLRVRIGLHTGEALATSTGYVGLDVHRAARICAAGYGGQILLSQTTTSLVRHELPPGVTLRDLGEHRLKDLQQPERIAQIVLPDLPSEFPALRSLSTIPNNLPVVQLTTFIGREREIVEIRALLEENRLLTLSGPGGCGKTRLALQVAGDLIDTFPHGVWFTELGALNDPALVAQAVSSSLALREERGRTPDLALAEYLQDKTALLILDTCEHLLAACASLVDAILRSARDVKILATSRERLGIAGEIAYSVPSLQLPDAQRARSAEDLRKAESVRLFLDRAITASARFVPDDAAVPAVAQIVRRLDGIPLAIELAAAKVKVLSVSQIAERLDDRFRLLIGGSRTALPRQQTLQATMDWSYDLLIERERLFLRRLSTFAGGFSLEAAEAVCTAEGIARADILDLLTALVDKSLVVVDQTGPHTRYRLLDMIRQYAAEKLAASPEDDAIRAHHRDWFLALVEGASPRLNGPDETVLAQLESDHENLRVALEWSLRRREAEAALRLAVAMTPFWDVRGYWTEGRQLLEATLAIDAPVPPRLQAAGLHDAGHLAQLQGDYERAEILGAQSLALAQEIGDARAAGRALSLLGTVLYYHNEYEEALRRYEEALACARRAGDLRAIAPIMMGLAATLLHRDRFDDAERLAREGLEAFRHVGDRRGAAFALNLLGVMRADRGDFEEARPLFAESLGIRRSLGDRRGIASSLSNLGLVARHQGDAERADALYQESLAIRRELGDSHGVAIALVGLGIAATLRGDVGTAATLLKESLAIRASARDVDGVAECLEAFSGVVADPAARVRLLGAAATLRAGTHAGDAHHGAAPSHRAPEMRRALSDNAYEAAWREGQSMNLDRAVAYASRLNA